MIEAHQPRAKEGDAASAVIVLKTTGQRRILLGLSQQPRQDTTIIKVQTAPPKTSTEGIAEVIDGLIEGPKAPEAQNGAGAIRWRLQDLRRADAGRARDAARAVCGRREADVGTT